MHAYPLTINVNVRYIYIYMVWNKNKNTLVKILSIQYLDQFKQSQRSEVQNSLNFKGLNYSILKKTLGFENIYWFCQQHSVRNIVILEQVMLNYQLDR